MKVYGKPGPGYRKRVNFFGRGEKEVEEDFFGAEKEGECFFSEKKFINTFFFSEKRGSVRFFRIQNSNVTYQNHMFGPNWGF